MRGLIALAKVFAAASLSIEADRDAYQSLSADSS